eukprot:CAMPEP_0170831740 /NCGR_PEP_ID=MMETSP0733-20121128/50336_1 /TAXON_ID=186038 /ORGANISM="Fragilariopsis kerguelensis, Strain L26-C5" /LENGTH=352 /DNA_ID=CAMNT_0011197751 /DNA_START=386 /DNA_END=1444 /DNA_ORIENTATION=-
MTSTATNGDERIVCKSKKKKKKKTKTKRKRNDIYDDDDYDNESSNKVVHATATAVSIDVEMTLVHKKMNQKRKKRKKKKQKQIGEKYFSVSTVVVSRDTSISSSDNNNECCELVVKQCTKKKKSKKKNKRSTNKNDDEDPNRKNSTTIPASQEEKSLHEKKRKSTESDTATESNSAIDDADDTNDNTKFPLDDSVPKQPSQKKQRVLGPEYTKKNCENWEKKFQLLVEYKKANNGSTLVPVKSDTHPGLGSWVHYQRQLYITDMLSTGRKDRLESISFVWKVRIAVPWIDMYHRLVAYQEQYGTTLVPKTYKEDPALGRWVQKNRRSCKEEDRRQLLKDIDFVWDARRRKKY